MKKLFLLLFLIGGIASSASAQGLLNKMKEKAVEKMKDRANQEADKAADRVLNGKKQKTETVETEAVEEKAKTQEAPQENPQASTANDFKRGSVIIFQDDITAEQVGEFPSKWDLLNGSAETKTLDGVKAIEVTDDGSITPLIKEEGAYLPEEFTLEYDFYYWNEKEDISLNDLKLVFSASADRSENPDYCNDAAFSLIHAVCDETGHSYYYNQGKEGKFEHAFKQGWHHVAVSFNKRALKVYFDGKRVVNLPRVNQPTWFCFQVPFDYHDLTFIRNVVLAKGAVALYDRDAQSMTAVEKAIAETGKFVTNNILFETGKASLKPESMAEIQKVADYMKKNPSARFEVQGHTDNQGSDKVNDPLSQQRAEAVVKALEELGCDVFNLRPVGKGSHVPVADNKTEAGRAQNRRVEFIKK